MPSRRRSRPVIHRFVRVGRGGRRPCVDGRGFGIATAADHRHQGKGGKRGGHAGQKCHKGVANANCSSAVSYGCVVVSMTVNRVRAEGDCPYVKESSQPRSLVVV